MRTSNAGRRARSAINAGCDTLFKTFQELRHKSSRRAFLRLAASAAVLPAVPRIVLAQSYPSRPVHMVVGFAAGSASDILARLIGDRLSQKLGRPFVIENRGGAGGTVGAEMAARAPADGYTLLVSGSADAVTATLYDKLNYSFLRDLAPIAGIALSPLVLVVPPSFPAETIRNLSPTRRPIRTRSITARPVSARSLIWRARCLNPTRRFGWCTFLIAAWAGAHRFMGGRLQAVFSTMPPAVAHVKAGGCAPGGDICGSLEAFPDLPTIGDFLPGYEASITEGLWRQRRACGGRQHIEQGSDNGHRGPANEGQACGSRHRAGAHGARRLRKLPRQRDGEVGQGRQSADLKPAKG